MATESGWNCPICCENEEDIAYMSPCLHQFCIGCALRWVRQKPNCPLCRLRTTAVMSSVRSESDYLRFEVPDSAELSAEDNQNEQWATELLPRPQVGGFSPEVWADFFESHPDNTRPLLPWLRQELRLIFEEQWWEVAAGEATIVGYLCLWGLDEEVLVQHLRNCLPNNAEPFVRQLITAAVRLCGSEIRRHLDQQDPCAPREEDNSPAASPSPIASRGGTPAAQLASSSSPAGSNVQEEAGPAEAALRGGPGCPPSASVAAEQEQPQQEQPQREPGQAAEAGPSACSHSPSAPGWGRDSRGRPWRPTKRRLPSPQDSAQACKRQRRQ
ncbi:TOPRS ligase, partial [Lophotis ruficrista]|nr:TOPRS ligase [Lophotis ruficrista]